MRHISAYKIGDGWHYASVNRRGGYPLGYCANHEPHPTELEARECYAQYQRDHVLLDGRSSNWGGCEVPGCDAPTKKHAHIEGDGYLLATLCDEHLTIEHAIEVFGLNEPAGDAWSC